MSSIKVLIVLKIEPDHIKALNNLAIKYLELNKFDKTFQLLNKAIEINSNYAFAHNNLV